jgi:putative Holliday junction resolvase
MRYSVSVRVVGVDLGERRIGLAISDASATLARPLRTIERAASDEAAVEALAAALDEINVQLAADDEVTRLVVGLPAHLDGSASEQTRRVREIVARLSSRVQIPITLQDERLSSHEADQRLAARERNWRARKMKLDAAAAAVILQDYLDEQRKG